MDEARKSLQFYREGSYTNEEIEAELADIQTSVEEHRVSGDNWTTLFKRRDLFERLWRAALLQFMAQMCGATAIKYYLPMLFQKLSLGYHLSLLISGIESTLKIGCTIIEMLIIDRFGRRITIIIGCVVMTLAMLVWDSFKMKSCY
jgi:Sugar (and other) transporter